MEGGKEGGRTDLRLEAMGTGLSQAVKQQLLECCRKQWDTAVLINIAQTAIRGTHKIIIHNPKQD